MRVRRSLDPWQWDPPFSPDEIADVRQRAANRAAQLLRLVELDAPSVVVQNQLRMVEEAEERLAFMAERPGPPTRISRRVLIRVGVMQGRATIRDRFLQWIGR